MLCSCLGEVSIISPNSHRVTSSMADVQLRRAAAASAFSRLKPEIYKTNDGKVIVEDELLNFLVVKMRTLSHDSR